MVGRGLASPVRWAGLSNADFELQLMNIIRSRSHYFIRSASVREGAHFPKRARGTRYAAAAVAATLVACVADTGDVVPQEALPGLGRGPAPHSALSTTLFAGAEPGTSVEISGLDELPAQEPLVEKSNGQFIFDTSCTTEHRNKLNSISSQMMSTLFSQSMKSCLNNGMISFAEGFDPELALSLMKRNVPTTVLCNLTSGNGMTESQDVGQTYERIFLNPRRIAETPAELAGTFMHEVAHTKGFLHPAGGGATDDQTMPETIGNCIESIMRGEQFPFEPHPNFDSRFGRSTGPNRERMPDDAIMSPIGAALANTMPVDQRCDQNSFASGIAIGQTGNNPRGIALACPAGASVPNVGAFPAPRFASCGPGEVLVGAGTVAVLPVGPIAGFCAPADAVANGTRTVSRVVFPDPAFASNASLTHMRICPAGMAVNGLIGRGISGNVGGLRFQCEKVAGTSTSGEFREGFVGSLVSGFTADVMKCEGRGALVRFIGSSANGTVYSLGGHCFSIESFSDHAARRSNSWFDAFNLPAIGHATAATSLGGSNFNTTACPADEAMIGVDLSTNSSGRLSGLRGICASVASWTNAALPQPALRTLSRDGSAGTRTVPIRCLRGELLAGFDVVSGTVNGRNAVYGVSPICRDYRAF